MNWIKEYWKSLECDRKERHNKAIKERANDIYQVTEYRGKLWFTYNGCLFCPCEMMKKDPLDTLSELRDSYITNLLWQ